MGCVYNRNGRLWLKYKLDGRWAYARTDWRVGQEDIARRLLREVEREAAKPAAIRGAPLPEGSTDSSVYFLQAASGPIKIGYTATLGARLRALRSGSPERLTLLGHVRASERYEKAVHLRFQHLRLRGEWFRPADELLEYIQAVATLRRPERVHERSIVPDRCMAL